MAECACSGCSRGSAQGVSPIGAREAAGVRPQNIFYFAIFGVWLFKKKPKRRKTIPDLARRAPHCITRLARLAPPRDLKHGEAPGVRSGRLGQYQGIVRQERLRVREALESARVRRAGTCCARLPAATEELRFGARGQVLEQWRELILKQPWTDEYKIKVQGPDGRELDVNR